MRETMSGAEQLKDDVNKYVNPRNNHHVLIYTDENSKMKEEVVTFWTVVERKKQGQPIYQLPEDGTEIITTLEANDMFLLGLNPDEINWEEPNYAHLNEHLYRVQKITSGDYFFRIHNASTILNSEELKRLSLKGLIDNHPIKVNINTAGMIKPLEY